MIVEPSLMNWNNSTRRVYQRIHARKKYSLVKNTWWVIMYCLY